MSCPKCPTPGSDEVLSAECGCDAQAVQRPREVCEEPIKIGYMQHEVNNIQAALTIPRAWNVPKCNEKVILPLPGHDHIPIGGFLWSSEFGLYQIAKYEKDEVTLLNTCSSGNAIIGATVPKDTTFIIRATPVVSTNETIAYLASDFVTPPLGQCTTVELTSFDGVAPGMQVMIGAGNYFITETLGGTVVRICENGGGGVPGTTVQYRNAFGQNQIPVTSVSNSMILQSGSAKTGTVISKQRPTHVLLAQLLFRNPYVNKTLAIKYSMIGQVNGTLSAVDLVHPLSFDMTLYTTFDNGPTVQAIALDKSEYAVPGMNRPHSEQIKWSGAVDVAASTESTLYVVFELAWASQSNNSQMFIEYMTLSLSAIGALI